MNRWDTRLLFEIAGVKIGDEFDDSETSDDLCIWGNEYRKEFRLDYDSSQLTKNRNPSSLSPSSVNQTLLDDELNISIQETNE